MNPSKRVNSVWSLIHNWEDECGECGHGIDSPELIGIFSTKENAEKEKKRKIKNGFLATDLEIKEWELQ